MLVIIKHHNHPFQNNEYATLLATGAIHHIILLK